MRLRFINDSYQVAQKRGMERPPSARILPASGTGHLSARYTSSHCSEIEGESPFFLHQLHLFNSMAEIEIQPISLASAHFLVDTPLLRRRSGSR